MPPHTRKHRLRLRIDRWCVQDSVEERSKDRKAAAEQKAEPERDAQGRPLNTKQCLLLHTSTASDNALTDGACRIV